MADFENKVHWIEVKLVSDGELAEALAEVLGRFDSNGVVIESVTQFNPQSSDYEPTGKVAVSGYLAVDEMLEQKRQKLNEALWHLGQIQPIPEPVFSPIKDQDWMAAWKKHYSPISIGEQILIMPAWKDPDPGEDRLVIRINPAMAFGTGTHPSTQLSLQLLEQYFEPGGMMIDVGCGSGILSIAALKFGKDHVLAVDIDRQAVKSTQENAQLNDISPIRLEVGKGSVEEILTGRFSITKAPLVVVNILAPVIIHLFELGMGELVTPGGKILLSGILDHQQEAVLQAAKGAGFKLIEVLSQEDWVGLALSKD